MSQLENEAVQRVPHFPSVTATTARLADALRVGKMGDTLTDESLAKIADGDCGPGGKHYAHLMSAIRIARRQYGVVWQRVPKAGYLKCLSDGERVDLSKSVTRRVNKLARRGRQILETVDAAKLSDSERREFGAQVAVTGALLAMSSQPAQRALVDQHVTDAVELPKLLAAFKNRP